MRSKNILLIALALASVSLNAGRLQAADPNTWTIKLQWPTWRRRTIPTRSSPWISIFLLGAVSVEDKWIPEIDVQYAFTKNLLAELVPTIPQKHDVYLAGVGKLGHLEHLPPTLSLVYEFANDGPIVPYVSGGLNFTWITNKRLNVAGIHLDLEDYSLGLALGAGFVSRVSENWLFDASVKWIDLESDVLAGGDKLTYDQLDPLLWSLGFSYQF